MTGRRPWPRRSGLLAAAATAGSAFSCSGARACSQNTAARAASVRARLRSRLPAGHVGFRGHVSAAGRGGRVHPRPLLPWVSRFSADGDLNVLDAMAAPEVVEVTGAVQTGRAAARE